MSTFDRAFIRDIRRAASTSTRLAPLALLVAAAIGCDRPPDRVPSPPEAKANVLDGVALQIQAAAAQGPDALAPFFDWTAMSERVLPPDFSHPQRRAFLRGAREGLATESGPQLLAEVAAGAYDYRGVFWRDGHPLARFRLLPAEGGFNFHDLVIERDPGGAHRVVDVYVLSGGDYMTAMVRGFAVAALGGTGLRRLFDRGASSQDIERLQRMVTAHQQGRYEDALAAYATIGPELRRHRLVQLIRVQAAMNIPDDERYLAVLDDVAAILGDDPAVSVLRLDARMLRQQWAACLADLEVLRQEYPDPFLDAFAGRVHVLAGDADRGLALADRAIAAEDALIEGHDVALLAALALGDTARAQRELSRLVDDHGVDAAQLADMEGYEGLRTLPPPTAE